MYNYCHEPVLQVIPLTGEYIRVNFSMHGTFRYVLNSVGGSHVALRRGNNLLKPSRR